MTQEPDPATSDYWAGTTSEPMLRVLAGVPDVARSNGSVLIVGEFGTGREALARLIHHRGPRAHAPFFRAVLSPEQFGGRGRFAPLPPKPWFGNPQVGSGGTLYLPLAEMSKPFESEFEEVLRRIVERQTVRTGPRPEDDIQSNARVLSSTRSDLLVDAHVKELAADLSSRLGSITIRLPPLRERMADFAEFVSIFANRSNRTHRKSARLDPAVVNLLSGYSWPGNLWQLRNVIAFFIWRATGDQITVGDLKPGIVRWRDRRSSRAMDETFYGRSGEALGTYLRDRL